MQATIGRPTIQQGRLEASPPAASAKVFAFTTKEATATSSVVTGQMLVNLPIKRVLFDIDATHSFIATSFTGSLNGPQDRLGHHGFTFKRNLNINSLALSGTNEYKLQRTVHKSDMLHPRFFLDYYILRVGCRTL